MTSHLPPQEFLKPLPTRDDVLIQWREVQQQAKLYAAEELRLRNALFPVAFPDLTKGQRTIELAGGWKLEGSASYNYSLANSDDQTTDALLEITALGPESELIASRLVSWKPTLRPGEYDKAPDNVRRIIDKVLTIKPAQVTLKLIPPVTP